MSTVIKFRVPPEVLAAAEARAIQDGILPAAPGRTGGAAEWTRRLVYGALGLGLPQDPHEEERARLTGVENPHHPSKRRAR